MRVWISGYFGRQNVGDEAILATVLQELPDTATPAVFTPANDALVSRIHSVPSYLEPPFDERTGRYSFSCGVGYWLRKGYRIAPEIPFRKTCIIAGGGCIHPIIPGSVVRLEKRILALKRWHCQIALLGIGVDRLSASDERMAAQRIMASHTAYCSVRDKPSAEALDDLACDATPYSLASDLVFALRLPGMCSPRRSAMTLSESTVGLNMRPLFVTSAERAKAYRIACCILADTLKSLAREVVLMPLNPEDTTFLTPIARSVNLEVAHLHSDPRVAALAMRQYDAVVGMRYHAVVLAAMQGIPCVPIPYGMKCIALSEELGVPCRDIVVGNGVTVEDRQLEPQAVIERVQWVWAHRDSLLLKWQEVCIEKARIAREDMQRCWNVMFAE